MREEIRLLQQRLGITAIYVTHDQAEALAISDRIVVMDKGRISQIGSPDELYRRPGNRFVAEFIGEANFLPARLDAMEDGHARITLGPQRLEVISPALQPGPVTVLARPEAIRVRPQGEGLAGTIQKVSYLGSSADYTVETELGSVLITDYDAGRRPAAGQPCAWSFCRWRLPAAGRVGICRSRSANARGARGLRHGCRARPGRAFPLTGEGGSRRIRRVNAAFCFCGVHSP
jgi:iron(III) transport system ATP-binding protein